MDFQSIALPPELRYRVVCNWKVVVSRLRVQRYNFFLNSTNISLFFFKFLFFAFLFRLFEKKWYLCTQNRDVAQLVAHYVRDVGVASSSPVIPTRKGKQPQVVASLFALQGRALCPSATRMANKLSMPTHWLRTSPNHPYPPLQSRRCTSVKLGNNILQMVAWESIFLNQAVACVEMTRLWAVLINCWLSSRYDFDGFWAWKKCRISVAVTVQSRRRYGAIASPLHCNRVAITP